MKNLIVKAISWKSGIGRYLLIIGAFITFKYLLGYKDKLGTCLVFVSSHLGVFATHWQYHVLTRWLSGSFLTNNFLTWLCIDLHIERGMNATRT